MYKTIITSNTNSGTEHHNFGVTDKNGRAVGAAVQFTCVSFEGAPEGYAGMYNETEPGDYLKAYGYATRDGEQFGPVTNSVALFKLDGTDDGETRAIEARTAWVEKYLKGAKARALKSHGEK